MLIMKLLVGFSIILLEGLSFGQACDEYTIIRGDTFDSICRAHFTGDTTNITSFDAYTLNRLFDIYKNDTGYTGSPLDRCQDLQEHWQQKELDLSQGERVSIPVILKLVGISSLNLSQANLENCDVQELLERNSRSQPLNNSLESLDLSQNNLTDFGLADLGGWDSLVTLSLANNNLHIADDTPMFSLTGSHIYHLNLSGNHNLDIGREFFTGFYIGLGYLNASGIRSLEIDSVLGGTIGVRLKVLQGDHINTILSSDISFNSRDLLFLNLRHSNLTADAARKVEDFIRGDTLPKFATFSLIGTSLDGRNYPDREDVPWEVRVTSSAVACTFPADREDITTYPTFQLHKGFNTTGRLTSMGFCGQLEADFLGLSASNFQVAFPRSAAIFR